MPIVQIQAEAGVDINQTQQYTGGGGMLPEGVYQIQLVAADTNPPKKADGHHWTRVTATVMGVLQSDDPKAKSMAGRDTSDIFSHSPKAIAAMRALVVAAKVQYQIQNFAGGIQGIVFDTDHLLGRIIEVTVQHEADNRPDAKYPTQARWINLQPQGTFAAAGGVVQSAPPGHVPGTQAAAPYIPGGYQPPTAQAQPTNALVASIVREAQTPQQSLQQPPQGYAQPQGAPPPQGHPQQAPQQGYMQPQGGYAPPQGSPPPPYRS